jgi:hypothetical protein
LIDPSAPVHLLYMTAFQFFIFRGWWPLRTRSVSLHLLRREHSLLLLLPSRRQLPCLTSSTRRF